MQRIFFAFKKYQEKDKESKIERCRERLGITLSHSLRYTERKERSKRYKNKETKRISRER
jgi:hypothetical protein